MKPVVRLSGDDAGVRAVAREAVELMQQGDAGRALFSGLWDLQQRRRRFLARPRSQATAPMAEASREPR
ncbi:hypothetical protein FVO59_07475 [Microbacterium esteraromaticum]|uniref:Uncharacterized protein n=1 Tax=Microbacterium esteraromaticum TaxID=57043 RepID=A0A7D8AFG3_9MICO|nr:hypothetical protein [Microbacterium esteraromaticum]QMU97083.1 hypothetical protein FVO59_07475 [Microbacterium esteraromaticum]